MATGPTGIVGNSGMSFGIAGGSAVFIFANLNGSISAWNMYDSATQRRLDGRAADIERDLYRTGHQQRGQLALCRQWSEREN